MTFLSVYANLISMTLPASLEEVHGKNTYETPESLAEKERVLPTSLQSFEGTPLATRIAETLEAEGFDPRSYDTLNHDNYRGLPSTGSEFISGEGRPSPIVEMIYAGLENESIVQEDVNILNNIITPTPEAEETLSKLHLMEVTTLRDAETGDVLGYATALTADAGRTDHVIVGPNALTITPKEEQ